MPTERIPGKPSTWRYTPAEREQAVRLVRQLRKELGTDQGTVTRVAKQLGYRVESVRAWVNQADIDGGLKDHQHRGRRPDQGARTGEPRAQAGQRDLAQGLRYFAQAELDRPPW